MRRQGGYTVVEMLIVVVLTSTMSIIIFGFGYDFLKNAASLQARTNFFGDRLTVSDWLRQNLGYSTGLVNQNTILDPNALVPDPNNPDDDTWRPLRAVPGVFGNSSDVTPIIYFTKDAINTSGSAINNNLVTYQNDFIIYHHGPTSELRVRHLKNVSATGNILVTTCTITTAGCPKDRVLLTGVKTVEMKYYSRSGDEIDYRSSCDPEVFYCAGNSPYGCEQIPPYLGCNGLDFAQVEVVQFKIKVQRKIESDQNKTINNSTIVRIALRNA